MEQTSLLCVLFALLAAASNALGTVLQRRAALTVPLSHGFHLRLITELLHRPIWLGGMAGVLAAACFQALALANGPLSVVQPIFVLELPFALLMAGVVLGRKLPRAGWVAVGCIVVGLATALAAASPTPGRSQAPMDRWTLALLCCGAAVAALIAVAMRRPVGATRAACLGTATAIGYALTAALLKSATYEWQSDGITGFFLAWQTYAFAATGAGSLFLMENTMQSGPLAASQPALTLGDATVSLTLGVTLYGERIRLGWWLVLELLGAALILVGAIMLGKVPLTTSLMAPSEARESDEAGEPARRR
ncbi:DMT family transporter [Wenjunlia tyrosinilytica]|uniref:Magnesium transporter n=1 Tax=Wenjunlia tyrosinilytica TaxID=1544741 RepID=A0A917ZU23_9ACTN|nr:DMT family transporter [Wenjunlia tyrosinilytica]GGO94041.1 hypothetical protein GCM10012280_47940 [Wenjunlia tyrosinilytica]